MEIKSVERIKPIHKALLPSYLKLSGYKVGLLVSFKV
ncbi:MAG: GxxExxY protein, partial [bacterium]